MKFNQKWNPAALLQTPLFAPLHPVLERLGTSAFPTLGDFNVLLDACYPAIKVQTGHALRFVPQEAGRLGFEAQYEPRCYQTGEVQTRPDNWHDLFNALVWLTFPKSKAAINSRHYRALTGGKDTSESQRGSVRDMATLLDESGVIVVSANAELDEMLLTFQWKNLFWQHRDQVRGAMGFYIFGHGLYEKCLQPYIGMTGQGLVLHVAEDFFGWTLPAQLSYLDERIAAYLHDSKRCVSPRELNPVPLLGVPGWSADNEHAGYYENTSYFRAGRRGAK